MLQDIVSYSTYYSNTTVQNTIPCINPYANSWFSQPLFITTGPTLPSYFHCLPIQQATGIPTLSTTTATNTSIHPTIPATAITTYTGIHHHIALTAKATFAYFKYPATLSSKVPSTFSTPINSFNLIKYIGSSVRRSI